jgi:hypothetical protein
LLGVDCGGPRPPLKCLSLDSIRNLKSKLEKSGLLELMLNGHTVMA